MAKLIRYQDGQAWELNVPNSEIANIFPNGTTIEVAFNSLKRKNVICNVVRWD